MAYETAIFEYDKDNGDHIVLTQANVRDLVVIGNKSKVTDQEVMNFMMLCKSQRLDPFIRDAYLIKYGDNAQIVTSKDFFIKRAMRNERYRGYDAGITVIASDGMAHRKKGSAVYPGETLVGGWCSVNVEGFDSPMFDEVSIGEYSTGKSNWAKMPGTMIRKVAICHALREAFPDDFQGLYDQSEMRMDGNLPDGPIEAEVVEISAGEAGKAKGQDEKHGETEVADSRDALDAAPALFEEDQVF